MPHNHRGTLKPQCPLCEQSVSAVVAKRIEKKLRVSSEKVDKLEQQLRASRTSERSARAAGERLGRTAERKASSLRQRGLEDQVATLEVSARNHARQLKAETTAARKAGEALARADFDKKVNAEVLRRLQATPHQDQGYANERVFVDRLRALFPGDRILHKGQQGDVVHFVRDGKNECPRPIVYELKLKSGPAVSAEDLRDVEKGLSKNKPADLGVLVTIATRYARKAFAGLACTKAAYIASPTTALTLAALLREYTISTERAQLGDDERRSGARALLVYVKSAEFASTLRAIDKYVDDEERQIKRDGEAVKDRLKRIDILRAEALRIRTSTEGVLRGRPRLTVITTPARSSTVQRRLPRAS